MLYGGFWTLSGREIYFMHLLILYTLPRAISSWFDLICEQYLFFLVSTPFHFWILPEGDRHSILEGKEEQGICTCCVAAMARQFPSLPPSSLPFSPVSTHIYSSSTVLGAGVAMVNEMKSACHCDTLRLQWQR